VDEFGFVSIPFMAFCGFVAVTVLVLAVGRPVRDGVVANREDGRP
jgi:ABC-type Fe3+-siderophore transport system permease subunit